MGKQVRKKTAEDNLLVMKGCHKAHYPVPVTVPFELLPSSRGFVPASMRTLHPPRLNLPTFNSDGSSFTPAFHLPSDAIDREHYFQKHSLKKEQY